MSTDLSSRIPPSTATGSGAPFSIVGPGGGAGSGRDRRLPGSGISDIPKGICALRSGSGEAGLRHLGRMTAPHWLALYAVLLGAWSALWILSAAGAPTWSALLLDLCRATVDGAGLPRLVAMWLLMSAAMMLPTVIPAFATHDEIADAQGTGGGAALVAGYVAVWAGFSGLAAMSQMALAGRMDAPWLAAALLALAGLYQFSPLKEACLSRCRMPLTFFMAHWSDGPFRMGLRLGVTCLGCCWALMALGLIGGAMSLGFMALATLLMTLEKLSRGALVPRAIGLACLGAAGYLTGGYL